MSENRPEAAEQVAPAVEATPDQPGRVARMFNRVRNSVVGNKLAVTAVTAVAALGGLALAAGKPSISFEGNTKATAASGDVQQPDAENCDTLDLTNTAFSYDTGKFLPPAESEVGDADSAAAYTQSWFNSDGPLAGTADRASLAVVYAVAGSQATQGNAINNTATYETVFSQAMKKLYSVEGEGEAIRLCKINSRVLGETVGYDDAAIAKGEQFTTFTAVNGKNAVTGLRLDHQTANGTISGTTFQIQNQETPNGLNGFTEIVVEDDGTIDVKGYLPIAGKEKNDKENGKGGNKKQDKKNGKGGGTSGTSNGESQDQAESPNPGEVPEDQEGPVAGPNPGEGGPHGVKPGPKPSPSGPGTPPPVKPPKTPVTPPAAPPVKPPKTPVTPPPVTPPPVTPPPVTPPPETTPPPKGAEPAPDPNNPYTPGGS